MYRPWGSAISYGGNLYYELGNEKYKVYREFSKNKYSVTDDDGNDISKEFPIDKAKGAQIGEKIFGLDEYSFENLAIFSQGKVRLDEYTQKSMVQKIINMIQTGDEDFSYIETKKNLEKKLQEDVGTERTTTKPKNILSREVKKLKSQIDEIEKMKRDLKNVHINMDSYNKMRTRLVEEMDAIDKVIDIKEQSEKELKYQKARYDAKLDVQKEEKKRFENGIKNKKRIDAIIMILMNLVLLIAILSSNVKFLFFVPVLIAIISIILNNKFSYNVKAPSINIEDFDEIRKEVLQSIESKIFKAVGEKTGQTLTDKGIEELSKEYKNKRQEYDSIGVEIHKREIEIGSMKKQTENEDEILKELSKKQEELNSVLELEQALVLAISKLDEAYDMYRETVLPKFIDRTGEILSNLTNGKYSKVRYSDDNKLYLESELGNLISVENLSIGTIDELYLSFRISALDSCLEVPLVFDESFVYFDDERLSNTLDCISRISSERQIIILSCSSREEKILFDRRIKYKKVNIT